MLYVSAGQCLYVEEQEGDIIEEREGGISYTEEPVQEICTGSFCSCILYLRAKGHGVSGDARDLQPNYFGVPHKGDIALFKYSNGIFHASYVEAVFPSGAFYVSEANYRAGKYTERTIMADDPFLRGFIHFVGSEL